MLQYVCKIRHSAAVFYFHCQYSSSSLYLLINVYNTFFTGHEHYRILESPGVHRIFAKVQQHHLWSTSDWGSPSSELAFIIFDAKLYIVSICSVFVRCSRVGTTWISSSSNTTKAANARTLMIRALAMLPVRWSSNNQYALRIEANEVEYIYRPRFLCLASINYL